MTEERRKPQKISVKARAREINTKSVSPSSGSCVRRPRENRVHPTRPGSPDATAARDFRHVSRTLSSFEERQSDPFITKTNPNVFQDTVEKDSEETEIQKELGRSRRPGTSYSQFQGEAELPERSKASSCRRSSGKRGLPPTASSSTSQPLAPAGRSPIDKGEVEASGVTRSVFRTRGEESPKITSEQRFSRDEKEPQEERKFLVREDANELEAETELLDFSSSSGSKNNNRGNVLRKIAVFEASKYVSAPSRVALNRKDSLPPLGVGEKALVLRARSSSVDSPTKRLVGNFAKCNGVVDSRDAKGTVSGQSPVVNGQLKSELLGVTLDSDKKRRHHRRQDSLDGKDGAGKPASTSKEVASFRAWTIFSSNSGAFSAENPLPFQDGCQKEEADDDGTRLDRQNDNSHFDDIIDSLEKIRDEFDASDEVSWPDLFDRSGSNSLTNSVSSPTSEERSCFNPTPPSSERSGLQSDNAASDCVGIRDSPCASNESRLVVSGFDTLSNSLVKDPVSERDNDESSEERLTRTMDRRLTGNRFRAYSNYATAPSTNPITQNNGFNRQSNTRLVPNLSIKAIHKVPPPQAAILYTPEQEEDEIYQFYEDDERYYGDRGTLGHPSARNNYGRSLVRTKPQLPAYLTLGRRGTSTNNSRYEDDLYDVRNKELVLREENELEKIREILSGLDFSKYRKRPSRSTSNYPVGTEETAPRGFIRRSLSSSFPLSQPIERTSRKTSYQHHENENRGTNKLKELTRKLQPQMVSTAPSSPNLGLPKPSSPFSKKLPLTKRSFSYSNFETVPRQGLSNPSSPQTFRQKLQQNSLVRATATLPRRKPAMSGENPTSPYSLLASNKESHRADYLDLETGDRNPRSFSSALDTLSKERPKFEIGASESVERYSEPETPDILHSNQSTLSLLRRSRIKDQRVEEPLPDTPPGVPERRKRRKALGVSPTVGFQISDKNYSKSDTGRSLTYPLQNQITAIKEAGDYDGSRLSTRAYGRRPTSDISVGISGDVYAESFKSDALEEQMSREDYESGSLDDRNKSLKKKHHSDPGGEKPQLARVSGTPLSEIMAGSKSEPYLGDYILEDDDTLPGEVKGSRGLGKASQVTGSQTLPRREPPSRSLSVSAGTWSRASHRRYASDGGGPPTPTSFYPKFTDSESDSKSPQQQRRYYKKRLRGPYGEMLEEEMRKFGEKQKIPLSEELTCPDSPDKGTEDEFVREHVALVSHPSLDDNELLKRSNSSPGGATAGNAKIVAKRKVSANIPFLGSSNSRGSGHTAGASSLLSLPGTTVTTTSSEPSLVRQASSESAGSVTSATRWSGGEDDKSTQEESWRVLDAEKYSDTRTHVVGELYDTEHSYVESLQILVNKYMKPLKSPDCTNMIDGALVDEIFYQIPEILNHHESFLELLRQRLTAWDTKQKIGDVFVEAFTKQPIVDTYTAFINNWKSAKEAIKLAVQAKPAFAKFLEHMSREHKGKLTLDALLIMPVQRIPRYELLIKELLKHTQLDHPDHQLLVIAQKEVHDLAVKINRVEREAYQHEQMQQRVKDIEHLIEGVMDGGLGTKKERCFFLFSDLLLISSIKRKSGTIRKSSTLGTQSPYGTMEMNKYKLLMRFSLDNLDIAKCTDSNVKKMMKEIENLEQDLSSLNQISDIASSLHCHHQSLDDVVRDIIGTVNKQLIDKQTNDTQLLSLDLTVTTQEGIDNLTIIFPTAEKRSIWEESFNEAKQKLALSTDRRPPPEFMYPLPIRKTRAGLQFTCSASTLGLNSYGLKDVWVCNSDGYVGQVCVLSLQPEPTLTSCNGVCNARILCAMSIPAAAPFYLSSRRKSLIPDNTTVSVSIHIEDADIEEEEEKLENRPNNGNFQLDSESSEDEEESIESLAGDTDGQKSNSSEGGSKDDREELDNMQPTMWLGTEDGCIHVYNCNDNVRIKKNKLKIQHSAAVQCIIYLDNRIFVSLANGELVIYKKDVEGGWNTTDVQRVQVSSSSTPVLRMLPVAGKLWCGCQNFIKVLNTCSLEIEKSFQVCSDASRPVICMVTSGLGVWIGIQHSAILRLFHATSYENLLEVNVAPAVTKMLSGCDNIIRQHKAACLRVTALLACKDLLWVGTSAGVILTLPLPHLTSNTTRLDYVPNVAGVPHGHTGHVRFMTCVEMSPGSNNSCSKLSHRSVRSKEGLAARRASTVATSVSSGCRLLVISGGDGYEDFRNLHSGLNEGAGHDDSTNHLLLWQV